MAQGGCAICFAALHCVNRARKYYAICYMRYVCNVLHWLDSYEHLAGLCCCQQRWWCAAPRYLSYFERVSSGSGAQLPPCFGVDRAGEGLVTPLVRSMARGEHLLLAVVVRCFPLPLLFDPFRRWSTAPRPSSCTEPISCWRGGSLTPPAWW
jgi:hypothetical protein